MRDILADNGAEVSEIKKRFIERNKSTWGSMREHGFSIDYDRNSDCLYLTLGKVPRSGEGLNFGDVVVFADPESLEAVGFEIPFFKEKLRSGALGGWELVGEWVEEHDALYFPPEEEIHAAVKQLEGQYTRSPI